MLEGVEIWCVPTLEQIGGHHAFLVIGHMLELERRTHVAECPHPTRTGTTVRIHVDPTVVGQVEADRLDAESVSVGYSPGRHEKDVGFDDLVVAEGESDPAVCKILGRDQVALEPNVPLGARDVGEPCRQLGVEFAEQPRTARQDRDLCAERAEDVREFGCDVTTSEDDHASRKVGESHHVVVRVVGDARLGDARRYHRT